MDDTCCLSLLFVRKLSAHISVLVVEVNDIQGLTVDNFTFMKKAIYKAPKEFVRQAGKSTLAIGRRKSTPGIIPISLVTGFQLSIFSCNGLINLVYVPWNN